MAIIEVRDLSNSIYKAQSCLPEVKTGDLRGEGINYLWALVDHLDNCVEQTVEAGGRKRAVLEELHRRGDSSAAYLLSVTYRSGIDSGPRSKAKAILYAREAVRLGDKRGGEALELAQAMP